MTDKRLYNLVKSFLLKQLGDYEPSKGRIIGKYYLNDVLTAGVSNQGNEIVFHIDRKIYESISDMFNIDYYELDRILIEIFSKKTGVQINSVYFI
jgi:hypothetical protein